MSITGGEQLSEQIVIATTRVATEITASLTRLSEAALKEVVKIAGAGLHKIDRRKEGKMTIKNLQRAAGGDLHAQAIGPELYHSMVKDLKKRGVDFSVEKGADSLHYVHFKGADVDTVRHALKQVEAKLALPQKTKKRTGQPAQASPTPQITTPQALTAPTATVPAAAASKQATPRQSAAYYKNVAMTTKPQTKRELTQSIQQRARTIKKTQTRTSKPIRARGAR